MGWTSNISGTSTYSAGVQGAAARFDQTGEYLQLFTHFPMSKVSFYIKGTNSPAINNWMGSFKIQESVNGSNWTDLADFTSLNTNNYVVQNINLAKSSHYLRFYFSNKITGCNVALDEILVYPTQMNEQEMNVLHNNQLLLSGSTSNIIASSPGVPVNYTVVIQNQAAVQALILTSLSITGPDAKDYKLLNATFPYSIAAQDSLILNIQFTPAANGTRLSSLVICSNDADEGVYTIHLYGVGGALVSEPHQSPTGLSFTEVKSYRLKARFNKCSADAYLVVRKQGNAPINAVPADGQVYRAGDTIGNAKVIYNGNDSVFGVNNIVASTNYQFAIFSYNGYASFTNYNTFNLLLGSATSAASMQKPSEYNGIHTSSPNFISDLTAHIQSHKAIPYSQYDETMVKLFEERDTTLGRKAITCVYSGEIYVYHAPFVWGNFSREHTYCHSWMPTHPADGSAAVPINIERPEYNDQHHLFPVNQINANAIRSNFPLGEVLNTEFSYLGCKFGLDKYGNHVFEPRDAQKGDAARALFYMATAYHQQSNAAGIPQDWSFKNPIATGILYGQDQDVLKKWHFQDLPDAREIARNDFIDSLQGNRNPFIDSVNYACYIDFSNMTKLNDLPCTTVSAIRSVENLPFNFSVFPNPGNGNFSVLLISPENTSYLLKLTDVSGRLIYEQQIYTNNKSNYLPYNFLNLAAGLYYIAIYTKKNRIVKKIVVE